MSSCSNLPEDHELPADTIEIKHPNGTLFASERYVEEIKNKIPQDVTPFVLQLSDEIAVKVQNQQKGLFEKFKKRYFSPWNNRIKPWKASYRALFCENYRVFSKKDYEFIEKNINNAQSMDQKAVMVRDAVAKFLPTDTQLFADLKKPGGCFPFDENIQSRLKVGVPVKVSAVSEDKKWNFVSCHMCSGWVHTDDVAYVDDKFVKNYQTCDLGVCVEENSTIENEKTLISSAEIGTILPIKGTQIFCPIRNIDGFAKLIPCKKGNFVKMPLKFSISNLRFIANQLLGQKYGWGGTFGYRDCSLMTMDFFAIFGIQMARNGFYQLKEKISVELGSDKDQKILSEGIPWLTIVGSKGHVMLYVGKHNNSPVYLHNIFALKNPKQTNDRYIIGETMLMSILHSYEYWPRINLMSTVVSTK